MKCVATLAAAAVLATAGLAQAATSTQQLNFSFALPSPGSQTLNFTQFNDLGGTRQLVSVDLTVDGSITGNVFAQNTTAAAINDFTVTLSGSLFGAGPTGLGVSVAPLPSTSLPVTLAPQGYAGDLVNYGTMTIGDTNTGSTTSNLASYVGTGNVAVVISGAEGFGDNAAPGDVTLTPSAEGGWGSATLTYHWVSVPEPATLGLLALSGLVLLRRPRFNQAAGS